MSKKIFFIAGEASGDVLGGALIKALKEQDPSIEISGVGGDAMYAQGLMPLIPMDELCVVGLWEIIGQLPRLLRLMTAMVDEIMAQQPDIVVTIDLPDFNFGVAKRLKKAGYKGKIVHYVAPSVWAWRPGRAKTVSGFLDGIMCLFPFEPQYFEEHGLKAAYVGHPLTEVNVSEIDSDGFCEEFDLPADVTKIGVFFGSRQSEYEMVGPVIAEAVQMLYEQDEKICLIAPTLPDMELTVTNLSNDLPCPTYVLSDPTRKWEAFKACDVAMAVSGTVGLELAYIGVPHAIGYKVHPVTWLILRLLVKVKYAHLGNILLDKPAIEEFLQGECTPYNLARSVLRTIKDPKYKKEKMDGLAEVRQALQGSDTGGVSPSHRAASFLLNMN